MEKSRSISLDIEHQSVQSDEAANLRSAEKVVRDMLTSWRKRLGGQSTITRTYPLDDASHVELTSDHDEHIIAHHTSPQIETTYEFDGPTRHLSIDMVPLSDAQLYDQRDTLMHLDSLGRLLFEADVQERSRQAAATGQ